MLLRLCLLLIALVVSGSAVAQVKVRTEPIRRPAPTINLPAETFTREPATDAPETTAAIVPAVRPRARMAPKARADGDALPAAVAATRDRILAAARSGDLFQLLDVMKSGPVLPVFSAAPGNNPIAYWKANYPETDGVEILSILLGILETSPAHTDPGTPQEMYVWPSFARTPLGTLTAPQKVELLRIVTGPDYQEMRNGGSYSFYRLGIAPDGTWRYFATGD